MKQLILTALLIFILTIPAAADDGVISVPSSFNVEETADRMERILSEKGMTIFNRIKHSQGAGKRRMPHTVSRAAGYLS